MSTAASVFGAMADAEDAPPRRAELRKVSLFGHCNPNMFARARDASDPDYAPFLSRCAELRELRISNRRGVDCTCLAALPRPELLHTLYVEVPSNVTVPEIASRIGIFERLRHLQLEFASERRPDNTAIVDVLVALAEKCPLLRTVRIKPGPPLRPMGSTAPATACPPKWTTHRVWHGE
eukprot:CAMPEP_0174836992 /NCGR_PEP_ID=MMETSP1114-20130205/6443_1 /TAXON_ID=312471 /ORGANISM="Neobodo designis, Strain CCAP 1951/1" /LENGTH=178 /DNA_ID=CAMNT_0016071025 /DNA_START=11 /DNA_END=544 /DNA_ORIENTATION=+